MSCIIDQFYACQYLIKFPTYTFSYVTSLLAIRLAYDPFHLFSFLFIEHETKESKTKTKLYYISRTRLQG